jgi:Holliday junction resolvase
VRAARVDRNQREIVAALRKAGASVQHLHGVGKGCPDLLVGYMSRNYLMEVKGPKGTLTSDQVEWHESWRGRACIVRSPLEALEAIGLKVDPHNTEETI